MKKWVFRVVLFLSLGGNACALLGHLDFLVGGGNSKGSPDGVYNADAMCLRQLNQFKSERARIWADLSISTQPAPDQGKPDYDEVIRLIVTPPGVDLEMKYREIEDLVRWSEDSKTVSFRLPNATITVTPQKTK